MILHNVASPLHLYLSPLLFIKSVSCLPATERRQRLRAPAAIRQLFEELARFIITTMMDFLHVKQVLFLPLVQTLIIQMTLRFVEAFKDHIHVVARWPLMQRLADLLARCLLRELVPMATMTLRRRRRDTIWVVVIASRSKGRGFTPTMLEDVAVGFVDVYIPRDIHARRLLVLHGLVELEFERRGGTRNCLVQVSCFEHLRHLLVALDRAANA